MTRTIELSNGHTEFDTPMDQMVKIDRHSLTRNSIGHVLLACRVGLIYFLCLNLY